MYKPPENENRVKSIKSKFENNDSSASDLNTKSPVKTTSAKHNVNIVRTLNNTGVRERFAPQRSFEKNDIKTVNSNQDVSVIRNLKSSKVHERLKLQRSFEKDEVKNIFTLQSNVANATKSSPQNLCRQFSDPAKRNIKRTPAFRLERNALQDKITEDKKKERLVQNKSLYTDNKLRTSESSPKLRLKTLCDNDNNSISDKGDSDKHMHIGSKKCALPFDFVQENSNFKDIRNKFNSVEGRGNISIKKQNSFEHEIEENLFNKSNINQNNGKESENIDDVNEISINGVTFLYAEPVPKALRSKESDTALVDNILYENLNGNGESFDDNIHNSSTLKLSESISSSEKFNGDQISNNQQHRRNSLKEIKANFEKVKSVTNKPLNNVAYETNGGLTDTIKSALKRPLPSGPAPKKPPRTFQHTPKKEITRNQSIHKQSKNVAPLNLNKNFTKKLNLELKKNVANKNSLKHNQNKLKRDPEYMLEKLERALKSSTLLKRNIKSDTTSEEDSDEANDHKNNVKCNSLNNISNFSSLFSNRQDDSPSHNLKFNFNCLPSFSCTNSPYEAIKESNSSFFINCKNEEPVYAEPFEYRTDTDDEKLTNQGRITPSQEKDNSTQILRRSLHYASSPIPDIKAMTMESDGQCNSSASKTRNQDQLNEEEDMVNFRIQKCVNIFLFMQRLLS